MSLTLLLHFNLYVVLVFLIQGLSVRIFYVFLSAPNISVVVKTEEAVFMYGKVESPLLACTFITEMHSDAIVGKNTKKTIQLSHMAQQANDNNWGWRMVNGSCDASRFYILPHSRHICEGLKAV